MAADIAPRRSPWDHPTELGLTTRAFGRSCESGSQTTADQVSRLVAPPPSLVLRAGYLLEPEFASPKAQKQIRHSHSDFSSPSVREARLFTPSSVRAQDGTSDSRFLDQSCSRSTSTRPSVPTSSSRFVLLDIDPNLFWSQTSPRPKPRSRFGTLTVTSARPLFAKLDCSPLLVFALRTVPATVAFWTSPVAVRLRLDHQCRRPLLDSFFSTSTLLDSSVRHLDLSFDTSVFSLHRCSHGKQGPRTRKGNRILR